MCINDTYTEPWRSHDSKKLFIFFLTRLEQILQPANGFPIFPIICNNDVIKCIVTSQISLKCRSRHNTPSYKICCIGDNYLRIYDKSQLKSAWDCISAALGWEQLFAGCIYAA